MSTYVLKLYVAGKPSRLENDIVNLRRVLDTELGDDYQLLIFDVIDQPQIAEDAKILATPTLIREQPLPVRRIIGDLSDAKKILLGLDLHKADGQGGKEHGRKTEAG
jgi:circadian clock protein KaiB